MQYNEQALDLVDQGLYQEAENALKNALQEDPENFTLHYNLAQVYTRSGQHQKAWRTFEHTLSLLPDASVYDREKVYFLVKASEWEAARKLLESLLEKGNQAAELKYYLGLCNLYQGDLSTAEKLFAGIVNQDTEKYAPVVGLALVAAKKGEGEKALNLLREAGRIADPAQQEEVELLQAAQLTRMGREEEAKEIIHKIARDNPYLHLQLGNIYSKEENWELAKSEYIRALSLDTELLEAKVGLAQACFCLGLYDESLKHAKEVVTADPGNMRAFNLCGFVYLKRAQRFPAKQNFEKSLVLNPDQPKIQELYASIK